MISREASSPNLKQSILLRDFVLLLVSVEKVITTHLKHLKEMKN